MIMMTARSWADHFDDDHDYDDHDFDDHFDDDYDDHNLSVVAANSRAEPP